MKFGLKIAEIVDRSAVDKLAGGVAFVQHLGVIPLLVEPRVFERNLVLGINNVAGQEGVGALSGRAGSIRLRRFQGG